MLHTKTREELKLGNLFAHKKNAYDKRDSLKQQVEDAIGDLTLLAKHLKKNKRFGEALEEKIFTVKNLGPLFRAILGNIAEEDFDREKAGNEPYRLELAKEFLEVAHRVVHNFAMLNKEGKLNRIILQDVLRSNIWIEYIISKYKESLPSRK